MAIVRTFVGREIALPSGSGVKECPKCGLGRCAYVYGPIPTKTESLKDGYIGYSSEACLDCGYSEVHGKEEREEYLKRMGRL